jgi:hypothetical protein
VNTDKCAAELGNISLYRKVVGQWTEDVVRSTILYVPLKPSGNSKSRSDQRGDEEDRSLENERKVHGDTALQRKNDCWWITSG